MPSGDGTGPTGMGPMTGRQAGFCVGSAVPGYANGVGGAGGFGRGGGGGFGGGRGRRNRFYATGLTGWQRAGGMYQAPIGPGAYPQAPESVGRQQQVESLKQQADYFEDALGRIRQQLDTLQTDTNKETE